MRWLWAALLGTSVVGTSASGCLKSSAQPCASGGETWVCPAGFACAEVGAYCGREDEVAACAGQGQFGTCTIASNGSCHGRSLHLRRVNACDPATEADLEGCTYTGWKAMTSPTGSPLHGVWAVGPADAYVVGDDALLHYDGNQWSTPPGLAAARRRAASVGCGPAARTTSSSSRWRASGSDDVRAALRRRDVDGDADRATGREPRRGVGRFEQRRLRGRPRLRQRSG